MGMHNDVAFLIADEINLYEQQSTYNPNMPLRLMQYTGNIYEKLITRERKNKFGTHLIPLPAPKLVVFYNGLSDLPDETTLYLSDAFPEDKRAEADIQVRVRMVNINGGHSQSVMTVCKPLVEYSWLVDAVREREKKMEVGAAIDAALDTMPFDFLIKPFLDANRVEVKNMLLTEYNEAEAMAIAMEEARAEGLAKGLARGKKEGRSEGEKKMSRLISALLSSGRMEDIARAVSDAAYREKLYAEFNIV